MNRIMLIGNGFDRAHGLRTDYRSFIDWFWKREVGAIVCGNGSSKFLAIKKLDISHYVYRYFTDDELMRKYCYKLDFEVDKINSHTDLLNVSDDFFQIDRYNTYIPQDFEYYYPNKFLQYISEKLDENWVDVEDAYHIFLVKTARNEEVTYNGKKYSYASVKDLNNDFKAIEVALGEYLERLIETQKENQNALSELDLIFDSAFVASDFSSKGVKALNRGMNPIVRVNNTLFLNFNYTKLETSYVNKKDEVVHIHGELGQAEKPAIERNPMIFGYGDESCDEYKELERMNDNTFLENIKSIKYLETNNYKKLLSFIESEEYQVFVMGHSCGNSDRTLLNTLFEHENCVSIKVFYHGYSDKNNYSDIVRNISRNFDDKKSFREKVVNERDCQRMPQYDKK